MHLSFLTETQSVVLLIAVLVAVSCSILGCFLIIRQMAMMTDSISHTVLLGIVIGFFITHDLSSPILILGAALIGLLTVYVTEIIHSTNLVSEDSSIGLVFPFFFSIAVICISKYIRHAHLDVDRVFLGELAFAPFNRLYIFDLDLGAKGIYVMGLILIVNLVFVILFFKELKITTFDAPLGYVLGISPFIIKYLLMGLVSVTSVASFESVGSILVIAFMTGPPACAYLITNDLKKMILYSCIIATIDSYIGLKLAIYLDVSIAGSIAMVIGITLILIFIFGKENGLITIITHQSKKRKEFAGKTMLFHLYQHKNNNDSSEECGTKTIKYHLKWDDKFLMKISRSLKNKNLIIEEKEIYKLTSKGVVYTEEAIQEIFGD